MTNDSKTSFPNRYPSRQEIIDRMAELDVFDLLPNLVLWKDAHFTDKWKLKSQAEKMVALTALAYTIYYAARPEKEAPVLYVLSKDRYAFHPQTNAILLDENRASILSTLHEVGHAVHGDSELEACAFSVKLFAKVFPNEYKRLVWHGHMLRLPSR